MKKIIKYTRLILGGFAMLLFSIFGIFFCMIRPFHRNNTTLLARFLYKFTYPLFRFKVIHHDLNKIDAVDKPCIFISNHQSNLDIMILGSMMPPNTVSLGKKDILRIPFFGQMYWLSGNITIDRFNRGKAMQAMGKVAKVMKEQQKNVWIMPEGTRSRTGKILSFKKGAYYTAIAGQLPIVPIVFSNVRENIDLGRWNSGTVHLKVLDPIETKGLTSEDLINLMNQSREQILKAYDEVNVL